MLRVSFILSSMRLSGGTRVVVEYARRLAQRGHLVSLVIPGGSRDPDMLDELGCEVRVIECAFGSGRDASAIQKGRLTWALARSVPDGDVVVATHTPTTVAGLLSSRVLRRGVPVWLYQDYLEMFLDRPLERWLLRNAARWQRRVLAISEYAAAEQRRFGATNVTVVHEGLSHAELFRPVPPPQRLHTGVRPILFLGDMRPRKGLYDFLAAAAIVYDSQPDIELWIVSKEPCTIESAVPFRYFYRPARSDLARLYNSCHLFVSASWWESFGLPPLEAMASATPVVLTDSGGVRDFAQDGYNCRLTPPRQPAALAAAMLEVLTDGALAERIAAGGPPTAQRYDWERVTDHFERTLAALAQ